MLLKNNPKLNKYSWLGFLVLIFFVWKFFITPTIIDLPDDFSYKIKVSSVDNFYDEKEGSFNGEQYSVSTFSIDVDSIQDGNLILKNVFDVKSQNGESIFLATRLYGIDPVTTAHVSGFGDKDRSGYLFAPMNLEAGDEFVYWHINYDAPAHMRFVEEEEIFGLKTLHYRTNYEGIALDQTRELGYLPGVPDERGINLDTVLDIWVEPVSGHLIKYRGNSIAYYYDQETGDRIAPWNKFYNSVLGESVSANVKDASNFKLKIKIVEKYVPATFFIITFIFLLTNFSVGKKINRFFYKINPVTTLGSISVFASAAVLVAWFFGYNIFTNILPVWNEVNPLTAVSFILITISTLLAFKKNKKMFLIFAVMGILFIFIRLLSIFGVVSFEIDLLLFSKDMLNTITLPRMSLFITTNFFILYISLFTFVFINSEKKEIFSLLPLYTLVLSTLGVVGYFFVELKILDLPLFYAVELINIILLIFTSISILFVHRFYFSWTNTIIILVLSLFLLITLFFSAYAIKIVDQDQQQQFNIEIDRMIFELRSKFNVYSNILAGGVGLFNSFNSVSRDEWKSYIDTIDIEKNYPGIQGVGYAVVVNDENKLEEIVRNDGFPDFNIRPESNEDLRTAIVYLEPFNSRNQRAFGYDMYSEENRRNAMRASAETGLTNISGKVTLLQETETDIQSGFLMYLPVYKKDIDSDKSVDSVKGFVYAAFRMNDFMSGLVSKIDSGVSLSVFDDIKKQEESELYNGLYADTEYVPEIILSQEKVVYLGGRPWTLEFQASSLFLDTSKDRFLPTIVTVSGLLVTFLLTFVVYSLSYSRKRALEFANEANKDLQNKTAQTGAILSGIGEGLFVTDISGKILFVNKVFESLLGITEFEVLNKKLSDIAPLVDSRGKKIEEIDRPLIRTIESKCLTKILPSQNFSYIKKNGEKLPVAITISPVIVNCELIGAVGVFRDMTKEREVDRIKSEFVSLASHQLRTPLSAIGWYSELLLDEDVGKLNKNQKEYLKEIHSGNARMVELVNSLLNVSRMELGTFNIELEEIDPLLFLQAQIKEEMVAIKKKKIKTNITIGKNIQKIYTDKKFITIIIQNLLSNSIKYNKDGGYLDVELKYLPKGTEIDGRSVKVNSFMFRVKDQGCGIPKKDHDNIFQKMFRAENVVQKDTEGTGLGLYLVKEVVKNIGGEIWFNSMENEGTEFYVIIPEEIKKLVKK